VNLPIKSIIPRLPDHVRMKVNLVGAANATIDIPVEKILEQLPHGSVNISIDELKQFAPPQVFAQVDGQDQLVVELPLAEILSRMDPALLKRKSEQKRIEIPGTVTDLFDKQGQALPQAATTPEEEAARLEALKRFAGEPPSAELAPKSASPVAPGGAPASEVKGSAAANLRDQALAAMAAAKPLGGVAQATAAMTVAPALAAGDSVTLALSAVSAAWPGEVRREMVEQNLTGATLALPANKVAEGLRVGHVVFNWKELRRWLNPPPKIAASPETAETLLEIPLSIVAPLLLPKIKDALPKKKAFIAESIPDIFGRSGEPLPAFAAVPLEAAQPIPGTPAEFVPTPAPKPMTPEPTSAKDKSRSGLGDIIGKPPRKPSNPNEVIQKLVALPGVVGALITLQEGLLVASDWAPGVKPDTLGGFVPQIFSRINQYMREMQLGEVHNATFVLEKSTLHIFKNGNLYFAVLGGPGRPLPLHSILAVASDLTPQHA
jgi:predicted regulator of Ras-like GTPase activity (Roadblock/LC7/MglB family)